MKSASQHVKGRNNENTGKGFLEWKQPFREVFVSLCPATEVHRGPDVVKGM